MGFKLSFGLAVFGLFCFLEAQGSFIKGNKNIPRVGRSDEADGPFEQDAMGYVIKTMPKNNVPRMGRRNYDSHNVYDIPKLYETPAENMELYGEDSQPEVSPQQIDAYYRRLY